MGCGDGYGRVGIGSGSEKWRWRDGGRGERIVGSAGWVGLGEVCWEGRNKTSGTLGSGCMSDVWCLE